MKTSDDELPRVVRGRSVSAYYYYYLQKGVSFCIASVSMIREEEEGHEASVQVQAQARNESS